MVNASARLQFAAGAAVFLRTAPYYSTIFATLVRRETPAVQTLAVSETGILYYNPTFVGALPVGELAAVLEHEVLHVVLRHAARAKARGVLPDQRIIWNIAADCAINETLRDGGRILPACGVFPETFHLAARQTAEAYFDLLLQQQQQQQNGSSGSGSGSSKLDAAAGVCAGDCGSAAGGNPADAEATDPDAAADARSQVELDTACRQTAVAAQMHAKTHGRGSVPAGILQWADTALAPPVINWRAKLARIVRGHAARVKGMTDLAWGAPSRRQAGLGFGPGRAVLPHYVAYAPNVAVILDTSGSMGGMIGTALTEIDALLRAVAARVTFVACDAQVHALAKTERLVDVRRNLKGGGGTDMEPAFAAIAAQRKAPDLIVCVTDAEIGDPGPQPLSRVLWVVVGGSAAAKALPWGDVVEVAEATERRAP